MTGIVLQARVDSTRLPAKCLLPMAGRPMLSYCLETLRKVKADVYVVATDYDSFKRLRPLAEEYGWEIYGGDPNDVLKRYATVAEVYGLKTVLRATGDNPLVSQDLAEMTLEAHEATGADYTGFSGAIIGTGTEAMASDALIRSDYESSAPDIHEHVSTWIKMRDEVYKVHRPLVPPNWRSKHRVTVDLQHEFEDVEKLISKHGFPIPYLKLREILK